MTRWLSKGIIYNTDEFISFLKIISEAPSALKALAKMVKRQMLKKQIQGMRINGRLSK